MTDRIRISHRDGIAVVQLEGEIDIVNAGLVSAELLKAAAEQPIGLVVDLSGLDYLDSGGVRMLFQVGRQLATSRRRLALVVPEASPLHRLVKITGLHEAAAVGAALADALNALRASDEDGAGIAP